MRSIVLVLFLAALAFGQERWHAPPADKARENPLKGRPELAAGGKKLFAKNCASCHDAPQQKGPNLSTEEVQQQSDGELFWKISKGNARSGMPTFSSLPEGQRWQLVLYIRTLKK